MKRLALNGKWLKTSSKLWRINKVYSVHGDDNFAEYIITFRDSNVCFKRLRNFFQEFLLLLYKATTFF